MWLLPQCLSHQMLLFVCQEPQWRYDILSLLSTRSGLQYRYALGPTQTSAPCELEWLNIWWCFIAWFLEVLELVKNRENEYSGEICEVFWKEVWQDLGYCIPLQHNENAKKSVIPLNTVALTNSTTIDTTIPERGISNAGETCLMELKGPESEDEISRLMTTAKDEEPHEKSDSSLLRSASYKCS